MFLLNSFRILYIILANRFTKELRVVKHIVLITVFKIEKDMSL